MARKCVFVLVLVLTCDGETAETPLLLEKLRIADGGVAANDNGVEDEPVLVSLDLADHVGLGLGGAVVVDNSQTALQSHVDGHLVLSDSVHGRRDEGGLEGDALCDGGIKRHLRGRKADVAGQQQEVIVGQTAVLGRVHELVEVEAILGLVLVQHVESRGVVEDLGVAAGDGHGGGTRRTGEVEDGRVDRASYGLEPTVKIDGTLLPVRKKREGKGRDPPKTFLYAGPWRSPRVSRCAVRGSSCLQRTATVRVGGARSLLQFFSSFPLPPTHFRMSYPRARQTTRTNDNHFSVSSSDGLE